MGGCAGRAFVAGGRGRPLLLAMAIVAGCWPPIGLASLGQSGQWSAAPRYQAREAYDLSSDGSARDSKARARRRGVAKDSEQAQRCWPSGSLAEARERRSRGGFRNGISRGRTPAPPLPQPPPPPPGPTPPQTPPPPLRAVDGDADGARRRRGATVTWLHAAREDGPRATSGNAVSVYVGGATAGYRLSTEIGRSLP